MHLCSIIYKSFASKAKNIAGCCKKEKGITTSTTFTHTHTHTNTHTHLGGHKYSQKYLGTGKFKDYSLISPNGLFENRKYLSSPCFEIRWASFFANVNF